jgi:hypothetical protein
MFGNRPSMACLLIAYSLCGTRRAHTNCRLQIPTRRSGICKCIHALVSPNIARSCNIGANASWLRSCLGSWYIHGRPGPQCNGKRNRLILRPGSGKLCRKDGESSTCALVYWRRGEGSKRRIPRLWRAFSLREFSWLLLRFQVSLPVSTLRP